MHVLVWVLTGLLAGWLARLAIGTRRYGFLGDLALGSLGAVVGGWLFRVLGATPPAATAAHFGVAILGAVVSIAAIGLLLRATERAATLAGAARAALALESLEAGVARLGELERGILLRFLRREPVARDPNLEFGERLSLGERLADRLATFGGSWAFLGLFATFLIAWMVYNEERPRSFDPYPFILLNLVLSCLAAVQAPVILMSQNRSADKDRLQARLDYEVNLKAEMEILALHEKLDELRERSWRELAALQEGQTAALERIERALAAQAARPES